MSYSGPIDHPARVPIQMGSATDAPKTSGVKTANGVIKGAPGFFHGLEVVATSAGVTVTIYDNASAGTGTAIAKFTVAASTTTTQALIPAVPIRAENGIYASTTTSDEFIVWYS